jgi:hypothetical protein
MGLIARAVDWLLGAVAEVGDALRVILEVRR